MARDETIFAAKKILTMSAERPTATHVAVKDGRVLEVGDKALLSKYAGFHLDSSFADKILMPGFIEGHSHALEGLYWQYAYIGFYDRRGPDGTLWEGLKSIESVVERLSAAESILTDEKQPLIAWGFDPIHFGSRRMTSQDLDKVSRVRPVVVMHASIHVLNTNSVVLEKAGISAQTQTQGVIKGTDREPTGELRELAAMFAAFEAADVGMFEDACSISSLWNFARVAQLAGVTTAADLYNPLTEEMVDNLLTVTAEEDYPLRIVPAYCGSTSSPQVGIDRIKNLIPMSTDKLHIGSIKIMTDGSIQGFTARLKAGTYYNGAPNGIWNSPPEELSNAVGEYHRAGLQMHIHTNGDEATEVMLDAIEAALEETPREDHRHTLQHCQLITEDLLQRAKTSDVCVNMFANHIYYWGEAHYSQTIGPERAETLEPFNTAKRLGVRFAMHSDAPVTHLAPLFTAWCAVNRLTATGRVLGSDEAIGVDDALRAITIDVAFTMKLDHLMGSIEVGKFADFAVLEEDPYEVDATKLKDIGVWGTVLGGQAFEATSPA